MWAGLDAGEAAASGLANPLAAIDEWMFQATQDLWLPLHAGLFGNGGNAGLFSAAGP